MRFRLPPPAVHLTLVLASSFLCLLLLELSLRGLAFFERRQQPLADGPQVAAGSKAQLIHILRPSEHPRQIYELRPQLDVIFKRQRLTTNRDGFRDRDYPPVKRPGTKRILGLGDSIMFGWGVAQEETYLDQLETMLNERSSTPWEVLNTAVPGYNTVMEVATLEARGLSFEPDLVIVGFCGNDFGLPQFVIEGEDPGRPEFWHLNRSFLVDFVARRLDESRRTQDEDESGDGFGLRRLPGPRGSFPEETPEHYREMIGWQAYERSLETLRMLSEQHRFEVLNLFFEADQGRAKTRAIELSSKLGFHVVDVAQALRDYMRQRGISRYRPSELVLSRKDPHPSAIGHRICAEELLRYLESRRLVT